MDRYFSKIYRNFLILQTDRGWVIPQLPNWSNGPVSQGPYSTYQIACHIIDRVLEEQDRGLQQSNTRRENNSVQQSYIPEYTPGVYNSLWEAFLFHVLALIILVSGGFGLLTLIGRHPGYAVFYFAVALGAYLFAKKLES
jgi:hypothetical protein